MRLNRNHAQYGITLIEVLVTAFILSVGLLGLAWLQSVSVLAGHTSTSRTIAVIQSAEIADRMRANRTAVANYDNSFTASGLNNNCTDTASTDASLCTPVQLAEDDVYRWKAVVNASFVNMSPTTTISVDVTTVPSNVTINMGWTERGEAMSYVTSLRI